MFGLTKHHITIHINELPSMFGKHLVVDIEDNENNIFVGLGLMDLDNPKDIYYFSDFELVKQIPFDHILLSGHNVKYDFHQLKSWGISLSPKQLENDTQLMAYVIDSSNRKNGLKDLARELLGIEYPSYKELVGKGKTKKTLDQHEVEEVANYCGMDVFCTYKLLEHFNGKMTEDERIYYAEIEVPTLRILTQMELNKVYIDTTKLHELDWVLGSDVHQYEAEFDDLQVNPRSPKQVLEFLKKEGLKIKSTGTEVLEQYKDIKFVKMLLGYRKVKKLHSTYTQSLLALTDLPWTKPNFNQALTVTGRLSSSDPINWQNIPRSEGDDWGSRIRECIAAPKFYKFLSADFSQIEYRLLAHFTQEPILLKAFREDKDVHEETGQMIGVNRQTAKTLNFCTIYGGHAKKVASISGVSVDEAEEFLAKYWDRLPNVRAWIEKTLWRARQADCIQTIAGRVIQIKGLHADDKFERLAAERQVVSYLIQGSASDIMKIAMIKLSENGYVGNITVHDEVDFILPEENIDQDAEAIKSIMEDCIKLFIPLKCSIGVEHSWAGAKS